MQRDIYMRDTFYWYTEEGINVKSAEIKLQNCDKRFQGSKLKVKYVWWLTGQLQSALDNSLLLCLSEYHNPIHSGIIFDFVLSLRGKVVLAWDSTVLSACACTYYIHALLREFTTSMGQNQ